MLRLPKRENVGRRKKGKEDKEEVRKKKQDKETNKTIL